MHSPDLHLRLPVRFADVAGPAGIDYQWSIPGPRPLDILQTIGNGCALLDFDNDGNLDALLIGPHLALYKGDGRGHFTDVTQQSGLGTLSGHFLGCAVGDYDDDGWDDVYVSGYRTGLLLHNEGGRSFRDVTAAAGLKEQPWGTCCAFGNFDGGPFLDLFICNYVDFSPDQFGMFHGPRFYRSLQPTLYHNLGGGRFRDVTAAWGVDKTAGRGLGAAFAPVDAAGHIGLAVANDMGADNLFVRSGPGRLKDVGRRAGASSDPADRRLAMHGRMGGDWGDYDNDGLMDLFVTTYQSEPKILLHNRGDGLFEDVGSGISRGAVLSALAFGAKWLDADNDGWQDLMITNGHVQSDVQESHPDVIYRQPTFLLYNRDGRDLVDATRSAGMDRLPLIVGRGLATGDYDNDGRVDALVVDSEGAPLLLHNESAPVGHWLSLRLEGVRCNRNGYGALIVVTAGGATRTHLCHADGSYLSSSDRRVHIGLGAARVADRVVVR